jgi:hypothetical protein
MLVLTDVEAMKMAQLHGFDFFTSGTATVAIEPRLPQVAFLNMTMISMKLSWSSMEPAFMCLTVSLIH